MSTNSFVPLSVLNPTTSSRIVASACSPEKDLVVIISRVANKDNLSLWKLQGAKKWEVEVCKNEPGTNEEIVDLTWSPDGETIAIAHHPPRLSLHSVHDGREKRSWIISPRSHSPKYRLTDIIWIPNTNLKEEQTYPDFFQRGGDKPGSAHSLLKSLPLLGPLADDVNIPRSANMFTFQTGKKSSAKVTVPPQISNWPSLPADLAGASIASAGEQRSSEDANDDPDDSDVDTVIILSDSSNAIHPFVDGTYPLGRIALGSDCKVLSVCRVPQQRALFATIIAAGGPVPTISSVPVAVPLLYDSRNREIARISTSARELMWFAMRVLESMKKAWFGGDRHEGARDYGHKWLRLLEDKQRSHMGDMEPNGIFELTTLLTTGRPSDALADLLAGGGKLSERGLNTWRTSVADTLLKLRDDAEKILVPIFQRVVILCEELLGCCQLPSTYGPFELKMEEIKNCLVLAHRGISIATWLADAARKEHENFIQFMTWLAWEAHRASAPDAATSPVSMDIFSVNEYLKSGLRSSHLDKWFLGPAPKETPEQVRSAPYSNSSNPGRTFRTIITEARNALEHGPNPKTFPSHWAPPRSENLEQPAISHLERNLLGLVSDLAGRLQELFTKVSTAPSRSASIKCHWSLLNIAGRGTSWRDQSSAAIGRIRTLVFSDPADDLEHAHLHQFLAMPLPLERQGDETTTKLVLIRAKYPVTGGGGGNGCDLGPAVSLDSVVLDCRMPTATQPGADLVELDVLDIQFFDQQTLVLVVQASTSASNMSTRAYLVTVAFRDLPFQTISEETDVAQIPKLLATDKASSKTLPISRSRELSLGRGLSDGTVGPVTLAVNGKRKVACVLDGRRSQIEVFDLDAEGDDDADDEEMAEQ